MNNKKRNILSIVMVLAGTLTSIIIHNLLPSPGADISDTTMDSIFVKAFGFPAVASFYFIFIFSYALFIIRYFGKNSTLSASGTGLRYGLSAGLLYITGMQEVIVDSSPFDEYGKDFIIYEFWMGLGDAVPVFLFGIAAGIVFLKNRSALSSCDTSGCRLPAKKMLSGILLIAVMIFAARTAGNYTGLYASNADRYPVQTMIWTAVFGITLGFIYFLLRPVFIRHKHFYILTPVLMTGVNWMWFNSFIVLIMADTAAQMLIRSGTDTLVLTAGVVIFEKIAAKDKTA
ncbi:MAG: hypothetical protein Q4F95_08280 [Oscillospiraceae bacterium]|nr:hypothetical protein [Oscillospiraceae bacterium]